jgi:hypothetical protein
MTNKKNASRGFSLSVPRLLIIFVVSLVLLAMAYSGFRVHVLSKRQEEITKDYMVVNSVSFGLLSVDEWRDNIIDAAKGQIQKFKLTPRQNEDLKKEITEILNGLINKVTDSIEKPQKSVGGKLKKLAFNALVNRNKLHQEVPGYSQKIMDEINKPSSYRRLKDIAQMEVDSLGIQIYDSSKNAEKAVMDPIFGKYHAPDKAAFDKQANTDLSYNRKLTYYWAIGLLLGPVLILFIWWLARKRDELHPSLYIMSILSAMILLIIGLSTTMIQIDARIASMDFHLLGQDVSFKNQVLFFQSKSILGVVHILIQTGKADSMLVGVLILVFSILFPVTKLLSTGIYILDKHKWAKNKTIHFFAFESGKWSMAEVLVIAVLMTFIGFNGIVNSTLSDLNMNNGSITSITTNNTSIQPGYIIFIGFVIYEFILSKILKNISHMRHIIVLDKK